MSCPAILEMLSFSRLTLPSLSLLAAVCKVDESGKKFLEYAKEGFAQFPKGHVLIAILYNQLNV
jgi:hypothetical protein